MEGAWRKRVRLPHVLRRLLLSPFSSSAPTPSTSSTDAMHESSDPKGEMLAFSGLFSSCPASRESFHLNFLFFRPCARFASCFFWFSFFFSLGFFFLSNATRRVGNEFVFYWFCRRPKVFTKWAPSEVRALTRTNYRRWGGSSQCRHSLSYWRHTLIPRYPIIPKLSLVSTVHLSAVNLFALIYLVCREAIAGSGVKVFIRQHQL